MRVTGMAELPSGGLCRRRKYLWRVLKRVLNGIKGSVVHGRSQQGGGDLQMIIAPHTLEADDAVAEQFVFGVGEAVRTTHCIAPCKSTLEIEPEHTANSIRQHGWVALPCMGACAH